MAVRHGTAVYPLVLAPLSATYTCSHGVSPGVAVLRCAPQPINPAPYGVLTITDGIGTVNLIGCRLQSLKIDQSGQGTIWCLELLDRRWRWRDRGAISGWYNQLDPHGKLIPY